MTDKPLDGPRVRYSVTVVRDDAGREEKQQVQGEPVTVAAFLRAVADQLDPPRKPMRAVERQHGGIVIQEPR